MKPRNVFRAVLCLLSASLALTVALILLMSLKPTPGLSASDPAEASLSSSVSASSTTPVLIPKSETRPTIDGVCGGRYPTEYSDAAKFSFTEYNAAGAPVTATLYLKHDNTYLYACMQALYSQVPGHFASLYLDYDNDQEPYATYDDLSLRVDIMSSITSTYRGTGVPAGYVPGVAPGWHAAAGQSRNDTAEYQVPISLTVVGGLCQQPFGVALSHHRVNVADDYYGWPNRLEPDQPQTWQTVQLADATCSPQLPVFRLDPVHVTPGTAQGLASGLSGIGSLAPYTDTGYTGTPRFTVPNTATRSLLQQYGASGGFFAFNPAALVTTTQQGTFDPAQANTLACNFLQSHSLFPSMATPPEAQNCGPGMPTALLPYQATGIFAGRATNQPGGVSAAQVFTTGMLVQVPLGVDAGLGNRIPLGGPGGHLSMMFISTTANTRSSNPLIDRDAPGLAALAEPFSRTFASRGDYPVVLPAQAAETLRAMLPGQAITPGNPQLIYYVADAAVPQQNLIPTWYFPDATALIDGHEVSLRGYYVPGVSGFLPTIQILSPANGSVFVIGRALTLTGSISGGAPPYSYTWLLPDGSTQTGSSSDGQVSLTTALQPPSHAGQPPTVTIELLGTDQNEAASQATLSLQAGPAFFLPLAENKWSPPGNLSTSQGMNRPDPPTIPYYFGIEAGWDYPPYGNGGPDLSGVVPDAFGLQSGMLGNGWIQRFFWANASAWEKDWRDCSLGGGDCTYGVDRADFAYFSGHGNNGGIAIPSDNHDSGWADGSTMRFQVARWVGFSSCLTLRAQGYSPATDAPIFANFNTAFQGADMLLGFNSVMGDVAFGPFLMSNMKAPSWFGFPIITWQNTIAQAWVLTAFQMNAGKPAYIWVVSDASNPYYDKLPDPTYGPFPPPRPYPFNEWDWVWWDE
jgi:hypothetical protein